MPRSVVYTAGQPGAMYAMSATSTASARRRCGSRASTSNSTLLPNSSSPSMRKRKLTGGRPPSAIALRRQNTWPLSSAAPARIDAAIAQRGRERRRRPFVQRVGRLDVIMAVEKQGRRAGHFGPPTPHDGMRVAAQELDVVRPEPTQLVGDPLRRAPAVRVVRGKGRDGRDAEKRRKLREQALVIHGADNLDAATSASQRCGRG